LQTYGLHWSGSIQYQSQNISTYNAVVSKLIQQHCVFPCSCSRKTLSTLPIYPGTCRQSSPSDRLHSLRVRSKDITLSFNDELQGVLSHHIADQHGDFIIRRKDNIIAYQLAVVVDDYQQNINHVIRGFDLLDSTPKQIYLQQLLGYPTPRYAHVPIITDPQGNKLSKQNLAQAVDTKNPSKTLFLLLHSLHQKPPAQLKNASVTDMLDWAIEHWNSQLLKNIRTITL
jgi:glutamyl-Q tRNA(Asp) synthetase